MRRFLHTAGLTVALLVLATAASAADRWFHVHVDDRSHDGAEVSVNLPLSLIEKAIEMIPDEVAADANRDIRLELNHAGFDLDELRELWHEVRDGEDAVFVTVKDRDATVEVSKRGAYFIAETVGATDETEVNVRFPLEVIDALFADPDRLDFAGAIRALANYGGGDMVTVRDRETTVRVWVDDSNRAD